MTSVAALIALLHLVWPFYVVAPVLPMDARYATAEPYLSGGAYAECSDATIRVNDAFWRFPPIWQASVLAHEQTHLAYCGTAHANQESVAYLVQWLFLRDVPDGSSDQLETWRYGVWRHYEAALLREQAE